MKMFIYSRMQHLLYLSLTPLQVPSLQGLYFSVPNQNMEHNLISCIKSINQSINQSITLHYFIAANFWKWKTGISWKRGAKNEAHPVQFHYPPLFTFTVYLWKPQWWQRDLLPIKAARDWLPHDNCHQPANHRLLIWDAKTEREKSEVLF